MLVRSYAFKVELAGDCTFQDLVDRLNGKSGQEFEYKKKKHRLYCSNIQDRGRNYFAGLFLTILNQKKFLQLCNQNTNPSIRIGDLGRDNSTFTFNFFLIESTSLTGLYTHYYTSYSLGCFMLYLRDQFIRAARENNGERPVADNEAIRAKSTEADLTHSIMIRERDFLSQLQEFDKVKEVQFDVTTNRTSHFRPIQDKVTLERRIVRLEATNGSSVINVLRGLIPQRDGQRLRVIGALGGDEDYKIDFFNPRNYESEDEFDNIATNESLNINSIESSNFINRLLDLFERKKGFLLAQ